MKEIIGDLWSYVGLPKTIVCITTNGTVTNAGNAVMGRGCAKEAKDMWPFLPQLLGGILSHSQDGPHVEVLYVVGSAISDAIITFPVKFEWWEKADLNLIKQSATELLVWAKLNPECNIILPRPGCGNGGRTWKEVKRVLEEVNLPDNVYIISKD